jgi:hypothetical protein
MNLELNLGDTGLKFSPEVSEDDIPLSPVSVNLQTMIKILAALALFQHLKRVPFNLSSKFPKEFANLS